MADVVKTFRLVDRNTKSNKMQEVIKWKVNDHSIVGSNTGYRLSPTTVGLNQTNVELSGQIIRWLPPI